MLLQQPKENKLSPAFATKPYEVVGRAGNEVLLREPHGGTYCRKVKQVKNLEHDGSVLPEDAHDVTDVDVPQSEVPDDMAWTMTRRLRQTVDTNCVLDQFRCTSYQIG